MSDGAVAKSKKAETEEERRIRKEKERAERKANEKAEAEAKAQAEGEVRKSKRDETEEERRIRKEKERAERKASEKAEAEAKAQAEGEVRKSKRDETEEERRIRKEKERAERKASEKAEAEAKAQAEGEVRKSKRDETEEERRIRKEKERAERKASEKAEAEAKAQAEGEVRKSKRDETEEERRIRKEKERAERKASEKAEAEAKAQAEGEVRKSKREETEEERRIRKEKERAERKAREAKSSRHVQDEGDVIEDESGNAEVNPPSLPTGNGTTHKEGNSPPSASLAAAAGPGNGPIVHTAEEPRRAPRREEPHHSEEAREREALERRERRRREREERKGKQSADSGPAAMGTSAIGVAELQRQGYRGQFEKDLVRATALRRLVDLDDVSVALADMPPQSQYDMYIRSFAESGRAQAAAQAPAEEDRADVEVQAERVRMRSRGAEVPRDLGLYPEQLAERPKGTAGDAAEENDDENGDHTSSVRTVDTELLANFLGRVFPVMRAILDENDGESSGATGGGKSKSETQFSTSYTTFAFEVTRNRPVQKVLFDPCSPTYVAVLHGAKEGDGPSKELDRYMSVIVMWNICSPSSPEKILVSSSLITSICISPRRSYLVYAGGYDGSLCVWDTREPERNHITAGRYQQNAFRLPSFATSWLSGNHTAPIVSVLVAGYNTVVGVRKDENEQLVSLDANGGTYFWVVNEKNQSKGVISDSENGLNMFSAVRLFLATYKNEDNSITNVVKGDAFGLDFAPADASHYVVACAEGVRHISRFGGVAAPSVFGPFSRFLGNPIAVPTCVRYSTVDSRVLVVGYGDGTVRLYLHTDGTPQLTIPLGIHRITEIRGSGTDKWLSWVLDAAGTLYLLDHAKKDKELPVFSHTLSQPETGLCTCFDLPLEVKGDARMIVLGFEKGIIQLHTLSDLTHPPSSDRNEHWL